MGSRSKTSVSQTPSKCRQKKFQSKQGWGWKLSGTWLAEAMAVQGHQLVVLLLLLGAALIKATEEEEEGTVLPYRTFLTTVEIIIICVVTVIVFVLTVLLVIYLCVYGCVLPECCKRQNKEYTPVMLERERKTTEIWKQNHTRASGGVQKLDSVA